MHVDNATIHYMHVDNATNNPKLIHRFSFFAIINKFSFLIMI